MTTIMILMGVLVVLFVIKRIANAYGIRLKGINRTRTKFYIH